MPLSEARKLELTNTKQATNVSDHEGNEKKEQVEESRVMFIDQFAELREDKGPGSMYELIRMIRYVYRMI